MIFDVHKKVPCPSDFMQSATPQNLWEERYRQAHTDRANFWKETAQTSLHWHKPFSVVSEGEAPFVKWFGGGKINVAYECLDVIIARGLGDRAALIWRGEPQHQGDSCGERRVLTYFELKNAVDSFATKLWNSGLRSGDTAMIYLPLIPEAVISMLACARLGVLHSVVFGGFSAESLRERSQNCKARAIITANKGFRRGKPVQLGTNVDSILAECTTVESVFVWSRETWGVDCVHNSNTACQARADQPVPNFSELSFDSENPLFVLYTSGTTGKPKGLVHTSAGYILWAKKTFEWLFEPKTDDVYWCTADVGWITGHTYVTYGPLANGATVFLYEGALDFPEPDRIWKTIAQEKITILYTAPTAIRAFMKAGNHWPQNNNLSSLRLLGSVGEPIGPEAWYWYFTQIGGERCPILDTWWQTETGGIMLSPKPSFEPMKPGSAMAPLPGIEIDVVEQNGTPVQNNSQGYLVIKSCWPSQARTILGDSHRYQDTYWSQYHDPKTSTTPWYFTGDGAFRDAEGHIWVIGRVDDVLNVSGHRLGTMELESAITEHPLIAEAAVVGVPDPIKGTGIFVYLLPKNNARSALVTDHAQKKLFEEVCECVTKEIGRFAKPDHFRILDTLPKTRSGKIMRRLLRDVAQGRAVTGDTSTLEDLGALASLKNYQED
jgi:acetyl-CoA synthetase